MHLRNGVHGYGLVSELLHWLTVAALVGQFLVGLTMEFDAAEDERRAEVFSDVVPGRAVDGGLSLPELRVSLGLGILALAVLR